MEVLTNQSRAVQVHSLMMDMFKKRSALNTVTNTKAPYFKTSILEKLFRFVCKYWLLNDAIPQYNVKSSFNSSI